MERFSFIEVTDILSNIGEGLGLANQALTKNASLLSTLAVKTASVQVDMEMSSLKTDDQTGFRLTARTLTFGTATAQERQRNTCSIKLEIVSVPTTDLSNISGNKGIPKPRPAVKSGVKAYFDKLTASLQQKGRKATIGKFSHDQQVAFVAQLKAATDLLDKGKFFAAKQQLNRFVAAFPQLKLKPIS